MDKKLADKILEESIPYIPIKTLENGTSTNPLLISLDSVKPESLHWLWKPYIPLGKLTMLEGDPGEGKSWVSLAIATAVSLGKGLPNNSSVNSGITIIASAEDGIADTIVPRLISLGADMSKIKALDGLFTLDNTGCDLLENYCNELKPFLVIIDPLVAFLSTNTDINKSNQVRKITARLAKIAGKYQTAILAIRHLSKGGSVKTIYRGLGSIDFTASARSVLLAGKDSETGDRGFVHIKSNLALKGKAIGYELKDNAFLWTGDSELTADKILSIDYGGSSLENAVLFLKELLASGPLPESEIKEKAKLLHIAERTLYRAKTDLKVKSVRKGKEGKKGGGTWYWHLSTHGVNSD